MGHQSHYEYMTRGPYREYVRHAVDVRAANAVFWTLDQAAGEYPDPALPGILLLIALNGPLRVTIDYGDGPRLTRFQSGDVQVVPPNTPGYYCVGTRHKLLGLAFEPDKEPGSELARLARSIDFAALAEAPIRDGLLTQICLRTWEQVQARGAFASDYVSAALPLVAAELARQSRLVTARAPSQAMTAAEFVRVAEYVGAALDRPLRVAELAALVNRAEFDFIRQFKRHAHDTPHRFIVRERIRRACDLLAEGKLGLAAIAASCGFASQSHFCTMFRRELGTTPSRYRERLD